jgi:uncharacterized integral membrane protein/uncharacterized protein YjeT (DUF2065 family)
VTRATNGSRPAWTHGQRLAAVIAVALVIVYMLVAAASIWLDLLLQARTGDRPDAPLGLRVDVIPLLLVTLPVVGAAIVLRRPRHVVGWLLLTAALLLAAGGIGASLIEYQVEVVGEPSAVGTVGAWLSSWVWFTFVLLGLVLVPLLFPDGRPPSWRWRPAVWAAAGVTMLAFVYQALAERIVVTGPAPDGSGRQPVYDVANPVGVPGLPLEGTTEVVAAVVVGAVTLAVFVAAWLAPIVRLRRGVGLERQQVKWLALVVGALPVVLLMVFLADNVLGTPANVASIAFYAWAAAVPVAVGVAILRHGLYEIDRIISRTVSYGLVVAVLGAVYAAGVVGPRHRGLGRHRSGEQRPHRRRVGVGGGRAVPPRALTGAAGGGPALQPHRLRGRPRRGGLRTAAARRGRSDDDPAGHRTDRRQRPRAGPGLALARGRPRRGMFIARSTHRSGALLMSATQQTPGPARGERFARMVAIGVGLVFVGAGLWAFLAPRSFFENAALFEPYNEHLIRDIGAFQLGLGAVLLLAAWVRDALLAALSGGRRRGGRPRRRPPRRPRPRGDPAVDIPAFAVIAVLLIVAAVARSRSRGL